jgi:hypothetical protein
MTRKTDFDVARRLVEVSSGGLVALNVVALLQTLAMPTIGRFERISIYLFAVAIPLLAFCFATTALTPPNKFVLRWYVYRGLDVGSSLTIAAISLLFARASLGAALGFALLSCVGIMLLYFRNLRR